jgi:hypothetical protein
MKDQTLKEAQLKICPLIKGMCVASKCAAWVMTNEGKEVAIRDNKEPGKATRTYRDGYDPFSGCYENLYSDPVQPPPGDGWKPIAPPKRMSRASGFGDISIWLEATYERSCEPRGYCEAFHKMMMNGGSIGK